MSGWTQPIPVPIRIPTFSNDVLEPRITLAARSSDWGANPILSFGPQEGIRQQVPTCRCRRAASAAWPARSTTLALSSATAGWSTMTMTTPRGFHSFTTQRHPLRPFSATLSAGIRTGISGRNQQPRPDPHRRWPACIAQPFEPIALHPIFAQILSGITAGSGGLEVVNGRVVRVPPRDNGSGWAALPPEIRDALMGLAVNQVAGQIADPAGRGAVGRAGLELAQASVARLLASPTPAAPKSAGVRSPSSSSVSPAGRRRKRPAAKS